MIPYSYNMVDMGGIDLAEANGTVVPGVYEKIVEAMNLCGDLILYNWKFAGVNITPSSYTVLQQASSILINGLIQVTELNQITVIGLPPPLVPVSPLEATANGIYEAEPPASGFNPVRVVVPPPVIIPLTVEYNGEYIVPEEAAGYNPVRVAVPPPVITPLTVESNGEYRVPEGVDGYNPISVHVEVEGLVSVNHNLYTYTPTVIAQGAMSAGFSFTVDRELLISKFRVFAAENAVSVHIIEDGVEIASVIGASVNTGEWNDISFPSNVSLIPGKQYVAWYSHNTAHPRAIAAVASPYIPFVNYIASVYSVTANTVPDRTEAGTMMGADLFIYAIVADI